MIDSHCHLADKQFDADLDAVIARAAKAGVDRMVCIADSIEEGERCREIAVKFENVFWTMGVHPHVSSQWSEVNGQQVKAAFKDSKCKAVGEIGLDYHYMNSPKEIQKSAFEAQLMIAKELSVPAVVHCRDAVEDIAAIVDRVKPRKMVLHCCTEKWDDVEKFVNAGYFLSFTGIATYPKSDAIRDTIRHCPIGQLMIETDSPYLAPIPHRGKRNEPAYVVEVARLVAEIKDMSLADVDAKTTANAEKFFGL